MTKEEKIIYGFGVLLVSYIVYKHFQKPPTVLVKGSDKSAPDQVQYSTGKEKMFNANGELVDVKNEKQDIFISPTNSIPNQYTQGIGLDIYKNASGTVYNLKTTCNKDMVAKNQAIGLDLPKIPQN